MRECECPGWVVQCIHYGGQLLILGQGIEEPSWYCVRGPSEFVVVKERHGVPAIQVRTPYDVADAHLETQDKAEAKAEFVKREQVLLGRE